MRFLLLASVTVALILSACSYQPGKVDVQPEVNNPDIGGGKILFYSTTGQFIDAANVGNLPDMVAFTPDGKTVISANEGEPSDDYKSDPKGSVSIIDLGASGLGMVQNVTTMFFDEVEIPADLRIKPGVSPAIDIEPEYVAINVTGTTAWVSLQENNGLAIIDIIAKKISAVTSLGVKDFWRIDIDSKDGANVALAPDNVYGLYQPDTIVSYQVNGKDYIVSANEGDDRDYSGWEDYAKASELKAPFSPQLKKNILDIKGRKKLRVLQDLGQNENGVYTRLYLAGTRSFSIWDAAGKQIYDSGCEFEQILAQRYSKQFNTRVDDTDDLEDIAELITENTPYDTVGDTAYFWEGVDARSAKKGCEPEALVVVKIGDKTFAYIGLEKQGGFFVYDITIPKEAHFIAYNNDIDYTTLPSNSGDLAPEGMVSFRQNNKYYLAIANELSSTVAIYQLGHDGKAVKLSVLKIGSFASGAAEIVTHDANGKMLFVTNSETNSVDIIDVADPAQPQKVSSIDILSHGKSVQSVAVRNGIVAIAVSRK